MRKHSAMGSRKRKNEVFCWHTSRLFPFFLFFFCGLKTLETKVFRKSFSTFHTERSNKLRQTGTGDEKRNFFPHGVLFPPLHHFEKYSRCVLILLTIQFLSLTFQLFKLLQTPSLQECIAWRLRYEFSIFLRSFANFCQHRPLVNV